jgi:hypothetical protein
MAIFQPFFDIHSLFKEPDTESERTPGETASSRAGQTVSATPNFHPRVKQIARR